jgi:GDP-mannose 6-dehydrogenase
MKINVFGLGYVGCITATCLANADNKVTGIDIDRVKVGIINKGKSPIVEPGLNEAIKLATDSGNLRATSNNIGPADISIICVGTPSNENGSLQLRYIKKIAEQIGDYIIKNRTYHVVNVRSTMLPGTIENVIIPLIETRSGRKAGKDFGICMNPEFMREGVSLHDYYNPPFTLIGQLDNKSGKAIEKLYKGVNASVIKTNIKVAEMIKYSCNCYHALKVSFANEIGNICKKLGIDSHEVMEIFCKDTKLNLSSYYLKPGFAYGGSCLPKDLRAIIYKAKELDLEVPLLRAISRTNENQIEVAYDLIRKTNKKNVGILGLSFKPGTDDLRESPMVELVEKLIGKGYKVNIYDKEVSIAKIFGSNKIYIERVIPHISTLMKKTVKEVIKNSNVVVIGNKTKEFENIPQRLFKNKCIVDLVRLNPNIKERNGNYDGICW